MHGVKKTFSKRIRAFPNSRQLPVDCYPTNATKSSLRICVAAGCRHAHLVLTNQPATGRMTKMDLYSVRDIVGVVSFLDDDLGVRNEVDFLWHAIPPTTTITCRLERNLWGTTLHIQQPAHPVPNVLSIERWARILEHDAALQPMCTLTSPQQHAYERARARYARMMHERDEGCCAIS